MWYNVASSLTFPSLTFLILVQTSIQLSLFIYRHTYLKIYCFVSSNQILYLYLSSHSFIKIHKLHSFDIFLMLHGLWIFIDIQRWLSSENHSTEPGRINLYYSNYSTHFISVTTGGSRWILVDTERLLCLRSFYETLYIPLLSIIKSSKLNLINYLRLYIRDVGPY